MTEKKVIAIFEPAAFAPLTFDATVCNGCNRCVEVCQVDILIANPQKGSPPIVLYPGECWYGGTCVEVCPREGAISLNSLSINRVNWKLKEA